MQTTSTFFGRRSYLDLIVVLAVAAAALAFGRWGIPAGGSSDFAAPAVSRTVSVPGWVEGRIAIFKQDQLVAQDGADGLSLTPAPAEARITNVPVLSLQERIANFKMNQLEPIGQTDGLSAVSSLEERIANFKMNQLDVIDQVDGVSGTQVPPSSVRGQTLAERIAEFKLNQLDPVDATSR
jgi:hypothetical protein